MHIVRKVENKKVIPSHTLDVAVGFEINPLKVFLNLFFENGADRTDGGTDNLKRRASRHSCHQRGGRNNNKQNKKCQLEICFPFLVWGQTNSPIHQTEGETDKPFLSAVASGTLFLHLTGVLLGAKSRTLTLCVLIWSPTRSTGCCCFLVKSYLCHFSSYIDQNNLPVDNMRPWTLYKEHSVAF